jgi:hypothetical protein
LKNVKSLHVPNVDELSIKHCQDRVLMQFEEMKLYLPEIKKNVIIEKDFFWGVFSTLHYQEAKQFITNALIRKNHTDNVESKGLIKIKPSIMEALSKCSYFSSKIN